MSKNAEHITGAEGVARVISLMDDPIVFGLPGGNMVQVFNSLRDYQDSVRCVLVREEALGTVMGEAYGRLTKRPAIVMAQGAWILGAGGIGVMEAHLGASPVVILLDASEDGSYSHHGPYQAGLGGYGGYDLAGAMSAITKRTFVALDPVQAVQMTQLAIKHAMAGEPGPVAVVFHSRSLLDVMSPDDARRIHFDGNYLSPTPVAPDKGLKDAAAALHSSRRPVIIAGNGARGDASIAALNAFARELDIPVLTTSGGKSTFPEDHDLAGGVIGPFGHDSANALVGESDLILALGTKLGATDTMNEHPHLIDVSRQSIIQVDLEALNIGWTYPVSYGILGTNEDVLLRLLRFCADARFGGTARVADARRRKSYFEEILDAPDDRGLLNPRRLARLLGELLPADAIVTCDAGENRIFMLHDFRMRQGGVILQPNGGGGMGYAVPAALAATYTHPSRMAVAVMGDGGFAMTLHGLMTAVENNRTLLAVVMDNQALGWVLHGQGERPFLSHFAPFDLARIAEAIGCHSLTARSAEEVGAAIHDARSREGVTVLVVKTDLAESFLTIKTEMAGRSHEEVLP